MQRYFGFSDILVETAGGGATVKSSEGSGMVGHHGLLEGIDNAEEVRDLIMAKWQGSRTSGLGDETGYETALPGGHPRFTQRHVELLEQIRDLAIRLT